MKKHIKIFTKLLQVCTLRVAIPEEVVSDSNADPKSTRSLMKELLEVACPQIHFGILRPANPSCSRVEDLLVKIDEQVASLICLFSNLVKEKHYF